MNSTPNARTHAVRIEVGSHTHSYVNNGQRVTLVPLPINRRQNRKLLIPPDPDTSDAMGGFDVPMIKTLGKGFYWKKLIDQGTYRTIADLARALNLEPGWVAEVMRMTTLAPDIIEAITQGRQPRCDVSIRCFWRPPELSLGDWKSPNSQNFQRQPDEHP